MSATGAFNVSVVGSQDDLTRLHASTAASPERFRLELTQPEQIEAIGEQPPDVAVIGADVERPLPIARMIRLASPQSEILFLLSVDHLDRFRATLPFVPNLASAWTASDASDAPSLRRVLEEAANASRSRAAAEVVLGRINQQIAARAAQPAEVRRSQLVLSERYLATILTQSPDAFLAVDRNGAVIAYNDAAVDRFGANIEEGGNIADAQLLAAGEGPRLTRLIAQAANGETLLAEMRMNGDQDGVAYAELSLAPVHDEDGVIASVSITARDITARKRAERHQHLLIAELNHRVKNTLAVVQSLAHQTFTRDKPPREAIHAYEGRLSALAAAHNLLTRQNWEAANLKDVVAEALDPFCVSGCTVDGPDLRVPPQIAVSLTLALHELATNAQKYGAFSIAEGKVEVSWRVSNGELHFRWVESDGPPVEEPRSTGFGTRMLKRALAADLNGSVDMCFEPAGLVCQIRAPLPKVAEDSPAV